MMPARRVQPQLTPSCERDAVRKRTPTLEYGALALEKSDRAKRGKTPPQIERATTFAAIAEAAFRS